MIGLGVMGKDLSGGSLNKKNLSMKNKKQGDSLGWKVLFLN